MYVCMYKIAEIKKLRCCLTELVPSVSKDKIAFVGKRAAVCVVFKPAVYFEIITGIPRLIALHFIELHRYCIFYKLKVCGSPASSKSVDAIFPTVFAHFLSLSHFWYFLQYFKLFHYYVCYGHL